MVTYCQSYKKVPFYYIFMFIENGLSGPTIVHAMTWVHQH